MSPGTRVRTLPTWFAGVYPGAISGPPVNFMGRIGYTVRLDFRLQGMQPDGVNGPVWIEACHLVEESSK